MHPMAEQVAPFTFTGMKAKILLLTLFGSVLLGSISAGAQDAYQAKFHLLFNGWCVSNGPAGIFVVRPLNNKTILTQYAQSAGLPNIKNLDLIFHFNASALGDAIEIVDTTTSNVLATPFGLYFGEDQSLGRFAITNSFGSQVRKIQYVYTGQNSHSMGDAIMAEAFYPDQNNNTTNAIVYGLINYLVAPDGTQNPNICNGSFVTRKRFQ